MVATPRLDQASRSQNMKAMTAIEALPDLARELAQISRDKPSVNAPAQGCFHSPALAPASAWTRASSPASPLAEPE